MRGKPVNFQKILMKIAYWLVAISIVIMLGLTFFSNYLLKKQNADTAPEAVSESTIPEETESKENKTALEDSSKDKEFKNKKSQTYSADFFKTE